MEKFVPYEKLSKKKKRELDRKRRKTWSVNPVTRRPQNPKAYNRKKDAFERSRGFFKCVFFSFRILST